MKTTIIDVNMENLAEHPHTICFINPKHELYHKKVDWLQARFQEGLKIKLLYIEGEKKPVGFIEYVPGELCWRAVDAKDYMFIHCLYTNGKKHQHQGLGERLLQAVENDAHDKLGVAVVTSDNAFMATKDIFIKHGYTVIEESGKDQLMAKQFKEGPLPSIKKWREKLALYNGLHIVYSRQCPWVARFIEDVKPVLEKENLTPTITELTTAEQAQNAPSLYGVFNLIYNGAVLADRYISITRFSTIIKKEMKDNRPAML